jgi:hypothetical protein
MTVVISDTNPFGQRMANLSIDLEASKELGLLDGKRVALVPHCGI